MNLKSFRRIICTWSLIGLFLSIGSIWATNIQQVFLNLNHKRFQDSLRTFIYSPPYSKETKNAKISRDEIKRVFEEYAKAGIIDLKNHYISFRRDSAMGGYERTYVLYFTGDNRPIFVGSEKNSSISDNYTGHFALCQDAGAKWQDCTKSVLPEAKLSDFMVPGRALHKDAKDLFDIYYELPREGTKITGKIICDEYVFSSRFSEFYKNTEPLLKIEKAKFSRLIFHLAWDKENSRFVAQP